MADTPHEAEPGPVLPPVQAPGYAHRTVRRRRDGCSIGADDCIAEEVPVALIYNDRPHAVMMATPRDIEDFALGFSLSEAIVDRADEIERIEVQGVLEGIEVRLAIAPARSAALRARSRNLIGRSGCGLCGAETLEAAIRHPPAVGAGVCITDAALQSALSQLHRRQPINVATGATHAAAWADRAGGIVLLREDVGRHNALDKLIGALSRRGADAQGGFLVITSRASYEMVQKAATLGMTLLAAISAPTALAIHLAEETGLTLIGFARADGYVIYAHPQRIEDVGGGAVS
ncbi:MAG TPA: formate dehydrogenase accessory sulfurtransferase FdhD [Rhodanobacteraceae bacterium]|nr:formate dehydrogenase accessory sulfurtransferase FdhD [Rhodanobacteraceae bacterium]